MSVTVDDLQLRVAYRLGESAAASGVESSRRLQFINEGYKAVLRKHFWWWTEATAAFDSVANQASYSTADGFPSDIRGSAVLELRYDGTLYTPLTQTESLSNIDASYSNYAESYFIFNKKLYPVPVFSASGTDNVTMKYYKVPSLLTTGSDLILIPDEYSDILVAYCVARKQQLKSKRGSAADAFDEFNEILKEMTVAQNEYLFALKSSESKELEAMYE